MNDVIEINLDKNKQQFSECVKIDVIDNNYDYNNFFTQYLLPNKPVLIKNVANNWNSTTDWIRNNEINFQYLDEKYGKCCVTIYDCNTPYYNSQKTECGTFSSYLNMWDVAKEKLLYLKDWHLQNQMKTEKFYKVPIFFASDWLNEYFCENHDDDYRFVYIGPKGTWTPFHADVFTSFSWSTNVHGKKKWILFAPGEEQKLKDNLGNLPYDITKHSLNSCKYFEIVQNSGEAIFVPSGWYHQVWNLQDTISINHNWVNGCNVLLMWNSLSDALKQVENEINDCRDMENFYEQCQVLLKASYGMNFKDFYHFLEYIAAKRVNFIHFDAEILFNTYKLGKNHALFDLQQIHQVLTLCVNHPLIEKILDVNQIQDTLTKIETCVNNLNK